MFALADAHGVPANESRIGRFIVHQVIGRGAMGIVYRAHDPELDRAVAIKVHAGSALETDGGERLRREGQALARLSHPNVVAVYEAGLHGNVPFVAMELLDGVTLDEWMRERRTVDEIRDVFMSLARGLAAAHAAGLVHRDIKPRNVFIAATGAVKLGDFGLVRADLTTFDLADDSCDVTYMFRPDLTVTLSIAGALIGTPAYMAPEQLRGAVATESSDQFSFCAMLFEALYGVRPFTGASASEVTAAMCAPLAVPPTARRIPRTLRDLLRRGLSIEPTDRFTSVTVLLDALMPAPRSRRLGIAAIVVAFSVAASAMAFAGASTDDACDIEDGEATRVFSAERLSRITGASAERIKEVLETYARTWQATRVSVCRATTTGQQSSLLGDRQRACLERRLQTADELVGVLASAPTNPSALDAVLALEPVEGCARANIGDPDPPPMMQTGIVSHLDRELDRISNARTLGDLPATSHITRVVAAARAIDYPPLLSRALMIEADVLSMGSGQLARREELLQEAAREAAKSGDDEVVATIYGEMVHLVGVEGHDFDAALQWARVADVAIARANTPRDAVWQLLLNRASVLSRAGKTDEAIQILDAAIASRADEKSSITIAHAHLNLGAFLADQGSTRAKDHLRIAIDMYREAYGTDQHRNVIASVLNLGLLSMNNGELQAARPYLERGLVAAEAVLGPDHVYVATALDALAECEATLGDRQKALDLHRRAIVILTSTLGRDDPHTASAMANLADTFVLIGDLAQARPLFVDAIALLVAAYGSDHEAVGLTRIGYGLLLAKSLERKAARRELKAGLAIIDSIGPSKTAIVAKARAVLAKL
ncbi:MAG: protein kinase domain-containing protein [Kofleriaceae bacterium]